MTRINELVTHYGLLPHPEGGFYKETYRCPQLFEPEGFAGPRQLATAIYFLLTANNFSAFHRIGSDEMWHFYEGSSLNIHVISPDGQSHTIRLGSNSQAGEVYQALVHAGCWFASAVAPGGTYALVGCTVAPGFSFEDFELANRAALAKAYPQHAACIAEFTR